MSSTKAWITFKMSFSVTSKLLYRQYFPIVDTSIYWKILFDCESKIIFQEFPLIDPSLALEHKSTSSLLHLRAFLTLEEVLHFSPLVTCPCSPNIFHWIFYDTIHDRIFRFFSIASVLKDKIFMIKITTNASDAVPSWISEVFKHNMLTQGWLIIRLFLQSRNHLS